MAIVNNSSIESKKILQSVSLKIGGTSSLYEIKNSKVHSIIFHIQSINLQKNTTFKINARSISLSGTQVTAQREHSLNVCLRSWCSN